MSRATDEKGDTQPFIEEWNPSGYLWNAVPAVRGKSEAVRLDCRRNRPPPRSHLFPVR